MTEDQALKRKKRKIWIRIFIGIVLIILGAYYFYQAYQTKYYHIAQNDNDRVNPTGKRAVCYKIGYDVHNDSDFPYTIHYLEGDITDVINKDPAYFNHKFNKRLSAFAQVGLLSEEKVGKDEQGRPIYRYDLTDKGREYVYWRRGMNFCFGKVVVERGTISIEDDLYGFDRKSVFYRFHYENVPDWVMTDVIKNLNNTNNAGWRDATYEGESWGENSYYIEYNGDWRMVRSNSGITL